MQIPQSNILTTRHLNRVFDKTVATYKYYWFLGMLDLFVKQGKTRMNVWEIMITMVANAWYPVVYFRLSFGKSESLYEAIMTLQKDYDIPINISVRDLTALLHEFIQRSDVRKRLNFLQLNVPFRFLRPWIDTSDDRQTIVRSQTFENGCLYKLERVDGTLWVELNPVWLDYLRENYDILSAFAYWGLTGFLQVRNPNVPNISGKLVKQEERSSLFAQHKFWNIAMSHGLEVRCLYTDNLLKEHAYDLDHFIPWSFVSHDLLWNLMPADSSINSSKSNRLPDLDLYLPKMAEAHQAALRINLNVGKQPKLLEDYLSLGHTPQEIVSMDREHLLDCFFHTFTPMHQIALNMGFEIWKY
ncbi:HNH endonuclease domain-containing protein [uncultured Bacteroides sp.]|uniref:HNH endonuclease domain-containing protein n=1 Tax=uncultured Bacteroides sp. TaxID=162156 RepID=UPI0026331CDD|nr:HNH endonuclease domain-containing protein [uncultured Bacteroides sp.]